jgi:hypothetical protein
MRSFWGCHCLQLENGRMSVLPPHLLPTLTLLKQVEVPIETQMVRSQMTAPLVLPEVEH